MCGLKRVSALILFLIVGGQLMLLPAQAYAWTCCGYCQCAKTCTCYHPSKCPMAGPCNSHSHTFQVKSLGDAKLKQNSIAALPFTVSKPMIIDRLTDLARGGECAHKKFTLNMLASMGDALQLEPTYFAEKNLYDTVAFLHNGRQGEIR